jgi:hypothetical protein
MGEYPSRHEQHRITDDDFADGWRESFDEAIDAALARRDPEGEPVYRDGAEAQVEMHWVKKRGDSSFHDHKVGLNP